MALEIQWSKRADKNFDKIFEYFLNKWGENVARAFIKKVYDFLEILAEFPEFGTLENRDKGIRGFTIVKQVNIFYRISENKIILLSFFNNRQNPKKKRF